MWFTPFASAGFSFLKLANIPESLSHVVMAGVVTLIIFVLGRAVYNSYDKADNPVVPDPKLSLRNVIELIVDQLLNLFQGLLGEQAPRYLPLLGTIFIYVFIANFMGLIPGLLPPTDNLNTNAPIALIVFLYYNYDGIREHGLGTYLKHFMGPVWWLAFLMIPIEIISHVFRPLSLSLRLFGNITGDHMVLAAFGNLTPVLVPVIFVGLGLFVCFMQAFVFAFLSAIYINLATSHDH